MLVRRRHVRIEVEQRTVRIVAPADYAGGQNAAGAVFEPELLNTGLLPQEDSESLPAGDIAAGELC